MQEQDQDSDENVEYAEIKVDGKQSPCNYHATGFRMPSKQVM